MQLHLLKYIEKKIWHRAQLLQRILWAVIIFDDSTYENNMIYRNIKYFVLSMKKKW